MDEDSELIGDYLLDSLDDLRAGLIELHDNIIASGVSRTVGLRDHRGKGCGYYVKSLAFFLQRDYNTLRELVHKADLLFQECERQSEEKHGK